jgi:hypothetical protein
VPRRFSNDTLIIAGALAFGLLSLAVPLAILMWAPDSEFVRPRVPKAAANPNLVRNPRSADLRGERLAFTGDCAVGDFKDKRDIEATINRQFAVYSLANLSVSVTDNCIAQLHGEVRNARERKDAIRAAGHPWIRAIDVEGLAVVESQR